MAAPTPTVRTDPTGFLMENGYQALITLANDANIDLWEKDVGQPGMDGGDPIDTTTQQNETYRTFAPRTLITLTQFTVVCGYDPCVYDDLLPLVNLEDTITITYPGGTTLAFYGYVKGVEFGPMSDGTFPEVTLTIVPTNWDHNNCVEAGPVVSCVGTC